MLVPSVRALSPHLFWRWSRRGDTGLDVVLRTGTSPHLLRQRARHCHASNFHMSKANAVREERTSTCLATLWSHGTPATSMKTTLFLLRSSGRNSFAALRRLERERERDQIRSDEIPFKNHLFSKKLLFHPEQKSPALLRGLSLSPFFLYSCLSLVIALWLFSKAEKCT